MIFAFGLPSYRFNDHAQRAVRASLDVQKSLTRMGMQAGVGINTGMVYCGRIGSDTFRCEYAIVGDAVNTAVGNL